MQEKWFTPQEVAERLKLDIKTVRRRLRSEELKGYKFGCHGDWRIQESDLIAFLETSTATYLEQREQESARH